MSAPGRLDRRITIEALTETSDSFGHPVQSWAPVATVWAHKRSLGGREGVALDQRLALDSVVWRIRYRADVTVRHRLLAEGQVWNISNAAEIGRRHWLDLTASAKAE